VAFPKQDVQQIVTALEERGTPPPEAATIVQGVIDAAGPLGRAIPVGYYSGATKRFQLNGSHTETIKISQASYVAWFQNPSAPRFFAITRYEGSGDRRAYEISTVDPVIIVRGYALPFLLFAVSLFLLRRRKLGQ
jgi:hypothetical protein